MATWRSANINSSAGHPAGLTDFVGISSGRRGQPAELPLAAKLYNLLGITPSIDPNQLSLLGLGDVAYANAYSSIITNLSGCETVKVMCMTPLKMSKVREEHLTRFDSTLSQLTSGWISPVEGAPSRAGRAGL